MPIPHSPEEYLQLVLFPENRIWAEFHTNTLLFFKRVLTEIEEAEDSVARYISMTTDPEQNQELLIDCSEKTQQMEEDILEFILQCELTADRIVDCRGDRTLPQSRKFLLNAYLTKYMFLDFEKVHGQEHNIADLPKLKRNVVDDDPPTKNKTIAEQFRDVTGCVPGTRTRNDDAQFDNLQVMFQQIQNAGDKIVQLLHQTKINLGVGNPYIIKFD